MPKFTAVLLFMLYIGQRPYFSSRQLRPELSDLAHRGNALMRAGDLIGAEAIFRDGLSQSRQQANLVYVSGFFTSLGVVRITQSRYRQALEFFLQSQDAARQADAPLEAGSAAYNIGVIYSRLGDWPKGHAAIVEATRSMAPDKLPVSLQLNLANYASRLHHYASADQSFRAAIDNAERRPETASLVAASWEHWGLSYLDRAQLDLAENCFLESYRQHRLAKRPEAEQLHYGFARLALARGDIAEARRRAAQYLQAARSKPLFYPLWEAYRVAAEIEERAGNLAVAHSFLLQGVDWARQARADRLPAAQLMATAESALRSLYLGLIRVSQALNVQKSQPSLILGALEAAEEGRSAALVENSTLLTDHYWQTLDQLQRTQARRLGHDTFELERESGALQTRLANFESEAGLRSPSSATQQQFIARARQALAPNEAILVFRTGERQSYVWQVTRDRLSLRVLPDEKILTQLVTRFRADILAGQALASEAGKKLFFEIIGEFSLRKSTYIRWTLVPDGPLHELPFAALPWPSDRGMESYLVEHRTLMLAPSIATLAIDPRPIPTGSTFAGIADPIYNVADPRYTPQPERADMLAWFRSTPPATFEMARLPGSLAEVDAAVRALQPLHPIVLTGSQVNRQAFLSLLERRTQTLHLATHVVSVPNDPRHALIALGINPRTHDQELVSADDLAARRHSARLVVMSGCGSGRGEVLPGVGLMSLTRAWLLSGATAVVASHWPVTDNSGALFARFYGQPATRQPDAAHWALALQSAQVESIHQHVPASVWAAYFLTGRN